MKQVHLNCCLQYVGNKLDHQSSTETISDQILTSPSSVNEQHIP